jgi:hypothetical protein
MNTRKGGHRYCPNCKKVVETRVLLEGYCQTDFHGIPAKKRQIICGTDAKGSNGCGMKWFTLEIPEDQVQRPTGAFHNSPDSWRLLNRLGRCSFPISLPTPSILDSNPP